MDTCRNLMPDIARPSCTYKYDQVGLQFVLTTISDVLFRYHSMRHYYLFYHAINTSYGKLRDAAAAATTAR